MFSVILDYFFLRLKDFSKDLLRKYLWREKDKSKVVKCLGNQGKGYRGNFILICPSHVHSWVHSINNDRAHTVLITVFHEQIQAMVPALMKFRIIS